MVEFCKNENLIFLLDFKPKFKMKIVAIVPKDKNDKISQLCQNVSVSGINNVHYYIYGSSK